MPATASVASAAVIIVTTGADDGDGNGTCSLREAVAAANTDEPVDACAAGAGTDTIRIPPGTYTLSIPGNSENANATGDLDVTSNLTIEASGAVIDAAGIDRGREVKAGATVTMHGGTVRGGYLPTLDYAAPTGAMGGGIHNAGTLTLDTVIVTGNVGDYSVTMGPFRGAGIGNDGTLTLTRTRVTGNQLGNTYPDGAGGGVYNTGDLTMTETTISGNRAWSQGGGLDNGGSAVVRSSTIDHNTTGCYECASEGAGVYNGGTLTMSNSTVSFNNVDAGDYAGPIAGGGIYNTGPVTLNNLTIANNNVTHTCDSHCFFATAEGAGVWTGTPITLTNSVIAENRTIDVVGPNAESTTSTYSDCTGQVTGGYDLIQNTASCSYTPGTGDVVNRLAELRTLQGNGGQTMTQELRPESPALDAGNPVAAGSGGIACNGTDQRGLPRSDDGNVDGVQRCDMGAVEMEAMDSDSYRIRYDAWSGPPDLFTSTGYRVASNAGATATFAETGSSATSSVAFITFKGPNMGRAAITVDGVSKGTLDLYAATTTRTVFTYATASAKSHSVVVRVLGTKNAASSGTDVRVDGFKRGATVIEDTSASIRYGYWTAAKNGRDLGGSVRVGSAGGTLTFDMVGPVFTFITERGPSFGKARVTVDGVVKATIDDYSPTEHWLSRQTIDSLGAGSHHVVIDVLGTKNPASSGTSITFDAITLR